MGDDIAIDIAGRIKACYDALPANEVCSGAGDGSDASIMDFRKEKLKIARDCVFVSMEIDQTTRGGKYGKSETYGD